jgi:hypothetical protein
MSDFYQEMLKEWNEEDEQHIRDMIKSLKYFQKRATIRRMNDDIKMADTIDQVIYLIKEDIKNVKRDIRERGTRVQSKPHSSLFA